MVCAAHPTPARLQQRTRPEAVVPPKGRGGRWSPALLGRRQLELHTLLPFPVLLHSSPGEPQVAMIALAGRSTFPWKQHGPEATLQQ